MQLERSVINLGDRTTQRTQTTITTQGQHGTVAETHTQLIFRTSIIRTTTLTVTSTRIITSFGLDTLLWVPPLMLTATTPCTPQPQYLLITSHIVEA